MATHGDVGLSQPGPSTITFKLDAISLDANSTTVLREVMVLGSPETTNALTAVLAATPKSTDWGAAVRIVSGPSTAADAVIRVNQGVGISTVGDAWKIGPSDTNFASSAGFHFNSSGELNANLPNISKIGPGDTNFASSAGFHFNSSGELNVNANIANSTGPLALSSNAGAFTSSNSSLYLAVRITNGTAFTDAAPYNAHGSTGDFTGSTIIGQPNILRSGAAASGSTDHFYVQWGTSNGAAYVTPADAAGRTLVSSAVTTSSEAGILTRTVTPLISNFAKSTTLDQSTAETVVSSAAATRPYVFAYSITSTKGSNYQVTFYDSATMKWAVNISSGYGGANLAVMPPAYFFAGGYGNALTVQTASSLTAGGAAICVSYFLSS